MGDETTKIFLNSKGRREGIGSDLTDFRGYTEGKVPNGKFTESKLNRKLQRKLQSYVEHALILILH